MFFKIGRQNIKGTGEIIDGEQEFQVDDFENICVSQTDFYEYQESEKLFNLRQNPKSPGRNIRYHPKLMSSLCQFRTETQVEKVCPQVQTSYNLSLRNKNKKKTTGIKRCQ